jgi:uncharacterized NAD(P)/FAD-binding protein YdhS
MSRRNRKAADVSAKSPRESEETCVVIAGGGFSGVAAAVALLEQESFTGRIAIIEPRARLGQGLAYGEARSGEILNTRVRDMSISASTPGDFRTWVEETGAELPAQRGVRDYGGVFARRALFGDYVAARFADRCARRSDIAVTHVRALAVGATALGDRRIRVSLSEGAPFDADALILAMGFGAPNRPARFGIAPFTPFVPDAEMRRVVLAGSSLTMADVLLRLRRDGYQGRIDVVSRRGLLPHPQSVEATGRRRIVSIPPFPGLARMARAVRRECEAEIVEGGDWRDAVNGVRPHIPALWRALSQDDRRRFQRRLRPYWDAHRHRLPLDQHQRIARELIAGAAVLGRGTVRRTTTGVEIAWRDGLIETILDPVIDCAGHAPEIDTPFIRGLVEARLVHRDDAGIGLSVDVDGAVTPAPAGGETIFALGPLGAGSLVEITATPEIAQQAALAARAVVNRLRERPETTAHQKRSRKA